MKKRVALARALVSAPDVLLLDEPTNHLDFSSIAWLEDLLRDYRGSLLFITHDRRFLDNVATRIVELDRGHLQSYPGNFTAYQVRKAEQIAIEDTESAKFDKVLAQEEVWIRKGVEARRTRNEGRVRRLEALRLERSRRRDQQGQVKLELASGERSGKIVAELVDVNKSYDNRFIVKNFNAIIQRGDKIGLIGVNGAGKTTLLRLILGEEAPDSGTLRQGARLQVAYFDQMREQLNDELSLVETIAPGSDWVEINGQRRHVMTYLNDFLFAPERARSPVKTLSGGERNRLLLARLFAKPANVLVLDEPTNDLDLPTLAVLEQFLIDFAGCVLLVSHDRYFMDKLVDHLFIFEGDGVIRDYPGNYTQYRILEKSKQNYAAVSSDITTKVEHEVKPTVIDNAPKKVAEKMSYKEKLELEQLNKSMPELEIKKATLTSELNNSTGDYTSITALSAQLASVTTELETAELRWLELSEKL
jgi:ATP-binding cassette subfamily F protein uup